MDMRAGDNRRHLLTGFDNTFANILKLESKALRFFVALLQILKRLRTAIHACEIELLDQVMHPLIAQIHHFTHGRLQSLELFWQHCPTDAMSD